MSVPDVKARLVTAPAEAAAALAAMAHPAPVGLPAEAVEAPDLAELDAIKTVAPVPLALVALEQVAVLAAAQVVDVDLAAMTEAVDFVATAAMTAPLLSRCRN